MQSVIARACQSVARCLADLVNICERAFVCMLPHKCSRSVLAPRSASGHFSPAFEGMSLLDKCLSFPDKFESPSGDKLCRTAQRAMLNRGLEILFAAQSFAD